MNDHFYTLITGASEGFGKALAQECASRKMNLILVSLPDSNLLSLAESIREKFQVKVEVIETDLSIEENCISIYDQVVNKNLQVNVLINNVGLGGTKYFNEESLSFYRKQIKINVLTTTLITHLFVNMLRKNGPSHILYVSSLSCFFHLIKKQVYGATKSYVYSFSKSLRLELEPENVNVSVICPGPMNTNPIITEMNLNNGLFTRLSTMEPEEVAVIAIDGLLKQKEVIIPGKMNKLFLILDSIVPSFLKKMITNHQMRSIKPVIITPLKTI